MSITEIIKKKRDGNALTTQELDFLLDQYLSGNIQDYHMSAWLMAVFFQSMTEQETSHWTRLMWKSGNSFAPAKNGDFYIDKHSTGGVGDKTSLLLVPIVKAVCDEALGKNKVKIPMISGRGLGHTGGTLDKLESVSGFSPHLTLAQAESLLHSQGFVMMGQTTDLAPADKRLYALRDVTATVESIPLIVSSILSKKLCESLKGIVFDVKVGSGAFMKTHVKAKQLAEALVAQAKKQNIHATAVLTDMSEPLGNTIGNFLEVKECALFLQGQKDKTLEQVTLSLASHMVSIASEFSLSVEKSLTLCQQALNTKTPLEIFKLMFTSQGGDYASFEKAIQEPPKEVSTYVFTAPKNGWIQRLDALGLGLLTHSMGGGRNSVYDTIHYGVGIELHSHVGDKAEKDKPLMTVYYPKNYSLDQIKERITQSLSISENPCQETKWILETI